MDINPIQLALVLFGSWMVCGRHRECNRLATWWPMADWWWSRLDHSLLTPYEWMWCILPLDTTISYSQPAMIIFALAAGHQEAIISLSICIRDCVQCYMRTNTLLWWLMTCTISKSKNIQLNNSFKYSFKIYLFELFDRIGCFLLVCRVAFQDP